MRTIIEMPDQAPLHHDTDEQHHRNRQQDRQRDRVVDHLQSRIAKPDLKVGYVDVAIKERHARIFHLLGRLQQQLHADGTERPQHEQRSMGEVDDAEGAENQRQTESDERIGPTLVQTVKQLKNDRVHKSH